jgi:hypothetical protein
VRSDYGEPVVRPHAGMRAGAELSDDGLSGNESNRDDTGEPIKVSSDASDRKIRSYADSKRENV